MRVKFVSTDCISHSFCIGCSENQFNRLSGHIEDDLKKKDMMLNTMIMTVVV